ncbi:MAG: helix-turn-helix domain-containing protein [Rhodospirillales bacterium]|nr:helix-turn-helix domain-containing protein [Rhodospirillales bacterium]
MTKKAHDKIMAGLAEALTYAKGRKGRAVTHRVAVPTVAVRAARHKLGMTQRDFARNFGVSLDTVRNWEQGRRSPEGPARVLLAVIANDPQAVLAVVNR